MSHARYSTPTEARYWTESPRTLAQAADQRAWENARLEARWDRAAAKQAAAATAATPQVPSDPRIGVLMRRGRPVYYAHVAGSYVEGTVAELEDALTA